MAKVGPQRASELTGVSKSTIQRAMRSGKLSTETLESGRRVIDVSELERVFGLQQEEVQKDTIQSELGRAKDMLEAERMRLRIKALEDKLHMTEQTVEDLRDQRDQWQKQAQQTLITSQYSQKQAEELKAEIKAREERARAIRKKRLAEQQARQGEAASSSQSGFFSKLLGKKAS